MNRVQPVPDCADLENGFSPIRINSLVPSGRDEEEQHRGEENAGAKMKVAKFEYCGARETPAVKDREPITWA